MNDQIKKTTEIEKVIANLVAMQTRHQQDAHTALQRHNYHNWMVASLGERIVELRGQQREAAGRGEQGLGVNNG